MQLFPRDVVWLFFRIGWFGSLPTTVLLDVQIRVIELWCEASSVIETHADRLLKLAKQAALDRVIMLIEFVMSTRAFQLSRTRSPIAQTTSPGQLSLTFVPQVVGMRQEGFKGKWTENEKCRLLSPLCPALTPPRPFAHRTPAVGRPSARVRVSSMGLEFIVTSGAIASHRLRLFARRHTAQR